MSHVEHIPVMVREVFEGLHIRKNGTYWDGTFGRGGHSEKLLSLLSDSGALFASDRDAAALAAASRFEVDSRFTFFHSSLVEALALVPKDLDGFLWDLGVSTPQLKDSARGFSFAESGPLDMRMDQRQSVKAADLVNGLNERELADLIYQYGEERFSRRIARAIIEKRRQAPIETTEELEDICFKAYPFKKKHRIHPATRTFQAFRIAVNGELDQLEKALPLALNKLKPGGRGVVMSFHSLEDRIVKHTFRQFDRNGTHRVITKKPLRPSEEELVQNPASRSTKLRVIEACQS
ncbi:MAG: 16S rRNA (cytosine(1402)-N(4))-methyltransferase [Acidobacteria bacterium]|nr:MAG: 16S rRNA (cytosine(1402)-N(4))-methyltransferase [Acidobacteriota bacterium]